VVFIVAILIQLVCKHVALVIGMRRGRKLRIFFLDRTDFSLSFLSVLIGPLLLLFTILVILFLASSFDDLGIDEGRRVPEVVALETSHSLGE